MSVALLVDLVLVVLAVEVLTLAWTRHRAARGPSFAALLPNLGAGLSLVLVVRVVATGGPTVLAGALLALAGGCHVVDLVGRLKD